MTDLINLSSLKALIRQIIREEVTDICLKYLEKGGISESKVHEWVRQSVQQRAFNQRQAAKYIGFSVTTLNKLVNRGEIATTVNGTLKYYRKEDLDEWINSGITSKKTGRARI